MPVTIKKALTKAEMKKFIEFPSFLYKNNPYFVPNLVADDAAVFDRKKNAAYDFCSAEYFLAYRGGELVGRVAAIINTRANKAWNKKQVRFGWIDFIEDKEVAEALLEAVAEWGKSYGMDEIAGPLGFTDFDPEGMLVEGFDKVGTMVAPYNHRYYPEFMEALGFRKEIDWKEYLIKLPETMPEKYEKMARIVLEKYNLKIRRVSRADIKAEKYGHKLFSLINEAYSNLYGYSLLTERQIDQYVGQYLSFIDLRMVSFVETADGELVAAGITVPSIVRALQKSRGRLFPFGWLHLINDMYVDRADTLELLLVAVKPEYQNKGLNAIMFFDMIPRLLEMGFKYAESNPELETNTRVQALWGAFEHTCHKRRRIFTKKI